MYGSLDTIAVVGEAEDEREEGRAHPKLNILNVASDLTLFRELAEHKYQGQGRCKDSRIHAKERGTNEEAGSSLGVLTAEEQSKLTN